MPLGFEARSHACRRRFGRQRQSGGPFPLTPALSPEEREPRWPRCEPAGAHDMRKPGLASPSPWGEGRGEGELCSRRFHGSSSSGQVTLQTKGQFLAALDRRSAPRSDLNSYDILESVRPTNLPKRELAIYLFLDPNQAKEWAARKKRPLYLAELWQKEILLKADWRWLQMILDAIKTGSSQANELARNYWEGKLTPDPWWELLVTSATVVKEITIPDKERFKLRLQQKGLPDFSG